MSFELKFSSNILLWQELITRVTSEAFEFALKDIPAGEMFQLP